MKLRTVCAAVVVATLGTLLLTVSPASAAGDPADKCYGNACQGYYWTRYNCVSTWKSPAMQLRHSQTNKPYGNAKVVLHYSSKCATTWAEVTGADTSCYATVFRSTDFNGNPSYSEPVDPGLTYAYTKMLDDSNGKLSAAIAYCRMVKLPDGSSTDFYYAETISY